MHLSPRTRLRLTTWVVALCALVVTGCASWQLPRIDPTGNSLFIWPNQQPLIPTVPGAAPPPPAFVPPPGNIDAPPVYSDPVAPPVTAAPAVPSATAPLAATSPTPPVAAPPAAIATASATPPPGTILVGREHLQLAPQNVMAPVGTEVVLKAGICTAKNHLLVDHRVEWMLAREGVGQILDLNAQRELFSYCCPWYAARKVDNWSAIGYTTNFPHCLDRGTADPNDDIQIRRGEAWISLTSSTEGTSHVTAFTPAVDDWQLRRGAAMIHWYDAQWSFPPSAVVEPGRTYVLTTTVSRRTNGVPVTGWTVRYEVVGGSGSLGYAGGNMVEAQTDATGRASIEVTPTAAGGGTATIQIVLLRPPHLATGVTVPLEVGRGVSTITWAPGGVSSPTSPPATTQPSQPVEPPSPRDTPPARTFTPPPDEPPPGKPRLDVAVKLVSPKQVQVDDFVRFEVTVTNVGDGVARGIFIEDRFDSQLSHLEADPNTFSVKYDRMQDLAPGQSASVNLTFEVVAAGEPCHNVTVTCEGAAPATARGCVTAIERPAAVVTPPPAVPTITVKKIGPDRHYVNESAKFKIVIKNTGTVPATNLRVIDRYDPALEIRLPDPGFERLEDGGLMWRIDRLGVGELREFSVQCRCVDQSVSACGRVLVTGDGINEEAEKCVEILPVGLPTTAAPSVTLSIVESSVLTAVGERLTLFVRAENTGSSVARGVKVRVAVPQELSLDAAGIRPQGKFEIVGTHEVQFTPVAELAAGGRVEMAVPVRVDREGTVVVFGQISADGIARPVDVQSKPIEILEASG